MIIVIGGKKSANTKHLWEICREAKPSYLIQGADDIDAAWLQRRERRRPDGGLVHAGLRHRRGRAGAAAMCHCARITVRTIARVRRAQP